MTERIWSDAELDAALAEVGARELDELMRQRLRSRVGLVHALDSGGVDPDPAVARPAARRGGWQVAVAAASAVGIVAVVVVVAGGDRTATAPVAGRDATSTSTAPAGEVPSVLPPVADRPVNNARWIGRNASDPDLQAGQYLYRRTDSGPVVEEWIPADRAGEWLLRRSNVEDPTEQRAVGGEFYGPRAGGWADPDEAFLAGLPRDPRALYEVIRSAIADRASSSPQADVLELVGGLLNTALVPADLRAAVLAAVGYVPGIKVRTASDKGSGDTSYGILEASRGAVHIELLFDQTDATYTGEIRSTIGVDGVRSGVGYVISHGVADRIGEPPVE